MGEKKEIRSKKKNGTISQVSSMDFLRLKDKLERPNGAWGVDEMKKMIKFKNGKLLVPGFGLEMEIGWILALRQTLLDSVEKAEKKQKPLSLTRKTNLLRWLEAAKKEEGEAYDIINQM